jgi:hypothetical protein
MMREYLLLKGWKGWKYKNTTLLILSLIVFFYFIESDFIQYFLKTIGGLGYLGSFFSGIMFVSVFTIAPASAILFDIAKILNPFLVAITAGIGAVFGDYILLRYLQNKVFSELRPIFKKTRISIFKVIFSSPFFAWFIPIIGMFIIASPFPDEVGIGLMGLSKIKKWQFILITFVLNSIGIFIVISLAGSI